MFVRTRAAASIAATLLMTTPARADAPPNDPLPSPLALSDVIARLDSKNPMLRERRRLATAAAARPRGEDVMPDPMLELSWWQQPVDFSSVPLMITARQAIPWASRLKLRREAAEREARGAVFEADDILRRLAGEARRAYFDLVLAESSLDLNDRMAALAAHLVEVVDARYRVGKAVQADVLRAQAELLVVNNERLDLEQARDEAQARLNGLLDRPADAPVPPTTGLADDVAVPDAARLRDRALAARPGLKRAAEAVRAAEARAGIAAREDLPEISVWGGYMANLRGDDGNAHVARMADAFSLGVSSTLPLFSGRRRAALVEAAGGEVQAARDAEEAMRRAVEVEVRAAFLQVQTAARHAKLHAERLVPLSDAALASAQASYEAGKIDLSAVLEAARAVRSHHQDHVRFRVDHQRRLSDLEEAVGAPLDEDTLSRGPRRVAKKGGAR